MKYLKTSPVPHTTENPIEFIGVSIDGVSVGTFIQGNPEFVIEADTVYLNFPLDPSAINVGSHTADVTVNNGWEDKTMSFPFVRPILPDFTVYISG